MHDTNVVSQFYFFMWNVWTKDVCLEIYGKIMGEHFWNKYKFYKREYGHGSAVARMYFDMTDSNRNMLVEAAIEHYKNQ